MSLEFEDVKEFQKLYAKEFGEEIDYETAEAELSQLIQFVMTTQCQ